MFQLNQLQGELEEEWRGKSERALASAREQQARDAAELTEQRDALELRLAQLQDKVPQPSHLTPGTFS